MLAEDLKSIAFWTRELSDAEVERAARGTTLRTYPPGAYICHRGDTLEPWTGVVSGLIKISAISQTGKAMTFAGIGAGGWFGEGTVLKGEPRRYDLVALSEVELALLARPTFLWLFETSVGFNRFLVHQLNERMGQFIATIECDRIHDPAVRVARHLAALCNPVLYPNVGKAVAIGQEELALLVGVSRPVVSRAVQTLEEAGLLQVGRREIVVRDRHALGAYEGA